jgi:NitT/TauT family transport system substrate-binding protein
MSQTSKPLRMNQGDPTEGRVYFLPHFVAAKLGYFTEEQVDVEFVWAPPGNYLAKSGQIPAVLAGEADFTVGGPMVTMRMQADGTARLMNFCALVQHNPWFLATREPTSGFKWSDLIGKTVLDVGGITTAALSLRWLLKRNGVDEAQVKIVETGTDDVQGIAKFLEGEGDYVFHSLHALGPYVADGKLFVAKALADDTGKVPWSAYIAKPETIAARAEEFDGFVRAIGRALKWVAEATPEAITDLVLDYYPGYPREGFMAVVAAYKAIDVWAPTPLIAEADFANFRGLLTDIGWISADIPYADQVPAAIAERAIAAISA